MLLKITRRVQPQEIHHLH